MLCACYLVMVAIYRQKINFWFNYMTVYCTAIRFNGDLSPLDDEEDNLNESQI